jgi:hypothetical protein
MSRTVPSLTVMYNDSRRLPSKTYGVPHILLLSFIQTFEMKLILFTLFFFVNYLSFSQSNIVSGGGDGFGNGGEFSYSVGQIDYINFEGTGGSVNSGNQVAVEIFTNSIDDFEATIRAFVYPNPVHNFLLLQTNGELTNYKSYTLIDALGNNLIESEISQKETKIDLSQLPVGTYFLKVLKNSNAVETFKIVKNQ